MRSRCLSRPQLVKAAALAACLLVGRPTLSTLPLTGGSCVVGLGTLLRPGGSLPTGSLALQGTPCSLSFSALPVRLALLLALPLLLLALASGARLLLLHHLHQQLQRQVRWSAGVPVDWVAVDNAHAHEDLLLLHHL